MRKVYGKALLVIAISTTIVVCWWLVCCVSDVERGADHGFVLTLEYTGQFAAGLRGIMNQQCWISSFGLPLVIVEPLVINSSLRNSYKLWNQNTRPFHSIVDIDSFNRNSPHKPNLVSWIEFYSFAPRKIVLVNIGNVHKQGCLRLSKGKCGSVGNRLTSLPNTCTRSHQLQDITTSLRKHDFEVVRRVCIDCQGSLTGLSPSAATDLILGPFHPRDVTIIINKWKFSFILTKDCETTCVSKYQEQQEIIHESQHVREDGEWYIKRYLSSHDFVSVLIRLEWFLIAHKNEKKGFHSQCFKEVLETFSQLESDKGVSYHPFLTTDVGNYGSGSFDDTLRIRNITRNMYDNIIKHTKEFVHDLYKNSWTFDDWEKSFMNIPEVHGDKGYIAAVQRSIASRGKCLIMMGGGHFQHMILKTYLQQHPIKSTRCIKLVCMAPPFENMFKSTIHSF